MIKIKHVTIYIMIFMLLTSFVFPYGNVYAETASTSKGSEKLKNEEDFKTSHLPKKGKEKVELISKRDKYSKTYLNPDGTFTTDTYFSPIHWKDKNNKWVSINNQLEKNENDKDYENDSNVFETKYPKTVTDYVSKIAIDGYEISMIPIDSLKIKGIVSENKITYKNIYKNVDFTYTTTSDGVKEDIILKNKNSQNNFSFLIKTKNLTPVLKETNVLEFVDKNKNVVFSSPAPFAYDKNDDLTKKIKLSLYTKNDEWYLNLNLDESWINDSKRSYPITIDPTILHTPSSSNIKDSLVYEAEPNSNFGTASSLRAGNNGYGNGKSFIKMELPSLYSGAVITSASLLLNEISAQNSTLVGASSITSKWDQDTVTWNTQPSYEPVATNQTRTQNGFQTFYVTKMVQDWYSGMVPNYGIALQSSKSTDTLRSFSSSETSNPELTPRFRITYKIDDIGSETFWAFSNDVNLKNGNLVVSNTDIVLEGRGIPLSFSRTYNSMDKNNRDLGFSWFLSNNMKAIYKNPETSGIILIQDDDGTKHHFVLEDGNWISPPGIDLELSLDSNKVTLTDKSQTVYAFDTNGRLESITDSNQNKTTFTYNSEVLTKITDASGRFINFSYVNGKIDKITGNEITTTKYTYDGNNNLSKVEKIGSDGLSTLSTISYEYDSEHNLIGITDNAGRKTVFSYYDDGKVKDISQIVTESGTSKGIKTSYAYTPVSNGNMIVDEINSKNVVTRYEINDLGNLMKVSEDYDTSSGTSARTSETIWDQNNKISSIKDPKGNSTILNYDQNNNVSSIENAEGYKSLMQYDNENNVTQVTGFAGDTIKNYYDNDNNISGSIDPSASMSLGVFDDYGNVTKSIGGMSLANNLVKNSGFDTWIDSSPISWSRFSGIGTINKQNTSKVNGEYSVNVNTVATTGNTSLISDYIPVNGNTSYNASFYGKTINDPTAKMVVRWYSSTTTYLSGKDSTVGIIQGNVDWLRRSAQIQAPENAIYARIILMTSTGNAFYDNIQFEEGNFINEYNYLVNSNFESDNDKNGKPDQWSNISSSISLDSNEAYTGGKSIKISGNTTTATMQQAMNYSGKKGDKITFGGYSLPSKVSGNGDYDLELRLYYSDNTTESFYKKYSATSTVWGYEESTAVATKDFKSFSLIPRFNNMSGTVWFDDVFAATTTTENAVVSKYNLANNPSFEYVASNKTTNWEYSFESSGNVLNVTNDEGEPVFIGERSMSLSNVIGWSLIRNDTSEPILPKKSYTFSVMAKADDVTSGEGWLKFEVYDTTNSLIGQIDGTSKITGNQDWTRIFVSATTEEIKAKYPTAEKIKIVMATNSLPKGHIYFDAVRFEEGSVIDTLEYDVKGNYVKSETDVSGNKTSYTVDSKGNITHVDFPKGGVTADFNFDELGRLTSWQDSSGIKVEPTYDAAGNVTKITYKNKNDGKVLSETKNELNELGEITKTIDQLGKYNVLKRDVNGNVTDIVLPNAKEIHNTYDRLDQLTKVSFTGENTIWNYVYDKNGNITQIKKNDSETTDYTYDPQIDRVTEISYPAISGLRHKINFKYDADSLITSFTPSTFEPNKTVLFSYYLSGLPSTVTGTNGQKAEYMYDEQSRLSKTYIFDGNKGYNTYYEYTDLGEVSRIWQETDSGVKLTIDDKYEYDVLGNITKITNSDNSREEFVYDNSNRLTNEKRYSSNGSMTRNLSYSYDLFGNRLSMTDSGITKSYSYDVANQLKTVNGANYSYDEVGNQISDGINTYKYNTTNQLVEFQDSLGKTSVSYAYNGEGLRNKKTVGNITEYYYYIGNDLAYITDENNKIKYAFTRDASGVLLTFTDYTSDTPKNYSYVLNYRGDVIGIRDSSGNTVVTYDYDSFGNILSSHGTVTLGNGKLLKDENPFRYAGYIYDSETNLYYVKTRYYDPENGRFITRDPAPNLNLYAYAENNPINLKDSSGQVVETIADVGFALYDLGKFIDQPSWKNAGYAAWSTASVFIPIVPGSYAGKALEKASKLRNSKGIVSASKRTNPKKMMRGSHGNIGVIPESVAKQLRGKTFKNFDQFREAFWKATANSPYAKEFSKSNVSRMKNGKAPLVVLTQQYGSQQSYVLHHIKPIQHGGGVYDLDNILIVTPRMHQDILSKSYHFGKNK